MDHDTSFASVECGIGYYHPSFHFLKCDMIYGCNLQYIVKNILASTKEDLRAIQETITWTVISYSMTLGLTIMSMIFNTTAKNVPY